MRYYMDKQQFEQFAEQIKDEVQDSDYKRDDVSTVPRIRIHQDRTQAPPEGSEVGNLYSPTSGFITPTKTLLVTILDMVNIRMLWTPFMAKAKHIICRCFDQRLGYGQLYMEEDDRWIPGEEQRECMDCGHNAFRNRAFSVSEPIMYNKKSFPYENRCKSGKLFSGLILPEGNEITADNVIPFYFQAGASMFSNAYVALSDSWEAFTMGCRMVSPEIPWLACKVKLSARQIDTANGPTFVPTFEVVGLHLGLLERVRAIEATHAQQLALKGDTQPIVEETIDEE